MSPAELAAWLLSLPVVLDGHGHPIPRSSEVSSAIAVVALEQSYIDARVMAATLDVLAAHEGAYRLGSRGDRGRSCGTFQTACWKTPMDGAELAVRQARLAVAEWRRAVDRCPEHPVWAYASGKCAASWVARRYEQEIRAAVTP
ncbi:MAG: hypothetical protein EBR82_12270 [Caulobacteraceae bacterium]|nr:hypothetical protein [Caulobacteraceae bacterium]